MSTDIKPHIKFLDGLRGLAFMFVFLAHTVDITELPIHWTGKIGVWLFFVLSAYLLTDILINAKKESFSKIRFWLNYFLRRVLRIYPLYIIVLGIDLFLLELAGISTLQEFKAHILLNLGDLHYWTIPVEFKMYLLLPIIIIILNTIKRILSINFAMISLITFFLLLLILFPTSGLRENSVNLFDYLPIFLAGVFAAYLQKYYLSKKANWAMMVNKYGLAVCLVLLALIIFSFKDVFHIFFPQIDYPRNTVRMLSPIYAIIWGTIILVFLNSKGNKLKQFFETKVMVFLGRISYPAYLIHLLVIISVYALYPGLNNFLRLVIIVSATFIFSVIAHYLLEKNFTKIRIKY